MHGKTQDNGDKNDDAWMAVATAAAASTVQTAAPSLSSAVDMIEEDGEHEKVRAATKIERKQEGRGGGGARGGGGGGGESSKDAPDSWTKVAQNLKPLFFCCCCSCCLSLCSAFVSPCCPRWMLQDVLLQIVHACNADF